MIAECVPFGENWHSVELSKNCQLLIKFERQALPPGETNRRNEPSYTVAHGTIIIPSAQADSLLLPGSKSHLQS